ncbi:MAG TPA: carbohydrate ABC transporter permease [Thermomicrobiales bacterium]|nr:carbohydrate ABC transporter permease [Thermomicrobiales bacterium]
MAELTQSVPLRINIGRLKQARRKPAQFYVGRFFFILLIIGILLYTLFPFYWAVATSLKTNAELVQTPPLYFPRSLDTSHYRAVFKDPSFRVALKNSVIVAVASIVIALIVGSLAAYAIGRFNFRGKKPTMYLILSMTMFPAIAILGSLYDMLRWAGDQPVIGQFFGLNSLPSLVFAYTTFTLPFMVWVLANFYRSMPAELEQAALVDGATPFRAFYQILLPLAAPGIATTALLAFIASWNEFLFASTFTITTNKRTVPVAIANFAGNSQYDLPWGNIMAASVVVTIPLIVLVLLLQQKIVSGLTAGAVKG